MDTSGDAVCWNSEGRRWRHPSTSNPKITQGVSRCDPSCSRNISDGIQQCLCGHCVSRVRENSIVTPLNFRTLEASWRWRKGSLRGLLLFLGGKGTQQSCWGAVIPFPAAASHAGDTWPGERQRLPLVRS